MKRTLCDSCGNNHICHSHLSETSYCADYSYSIMAAEEFEKFAKENSKHSKPIQIQTHLSPKEYGMKILTRKTKRK